MQVQSRSQKEDIVIVGETRDLGMEHVDSIDFMLKSTFY